MAEQQQGLLAASGGPGAAGRSEPAAGPASASATATDALTVEQILGWADAHHAAHGAWPAVGPGTVSGMIAGTRGESWKAINHALVFGLRGLPGDSSLAELLATHRGVPLPDMSPKALAEKIWAWEQEQFPVKGPRLRLKRTPAPDYRLTVEQILAWADAHHAAAGKWPKDGSGPLQGAPYDVAWGGIDQALRQGRRGLPGGTSLARLLAEHRGPAASPQPPRLTVEQILARADRYHAAHGRWPRANEQPQEAGPGVSWHTIDVALREGQRGFQGGSSLIHPLVEHRGQDASRWPPPLTEEQIVAWADAHHAATGRWPNMDSGPILQAPDESWHKMDQPLRNGNRGLSGGTSLARMLAQHRGVKNRLAVPRLSVEQILAWADAHHAATGEWPSRRSGTVSAAPDETWVSLDSAMRRGVRGLGVKTSLARILAKHRGVPNPADPHALTIEAILGWVDAHCQATGKWPHQDSGRIAAAPDHTWRGIEAALRYGFRGLPAGLTVHKLLAGRKPPQDRG